MQALLKLIKNPVKPGIALLNFFSPLLDLAIRIYIADIFFKSGLTKIRDWDTTLSLFQNEYHVPILPVPLAAVMGTGAELLLPILLVIGLATRFGAAGLFILNIVAVISYPELGEVAVREHFHWGVLLAVILLHGPGKISLDHFIWPRLLRKAGH